MATGIGSPPTPANRHRPSTLRVNLYRYFAYGWLFRDADAGSALERSIALRHNQEQARWLPLYMLRWCVVGAALLGFDRLLAGPPAMNPLLAVALGLALVLVAMVLLMTAIYWAFLRGGRFRGDAT